MMHMVLMDPKLRVFLASISLMQIVFFKDSSKIQALIVRMMKIFLALLWGGKRKMEAGEDSDLGLLYLTVIHFLVLLLGKLVVLVMVGGLEKVSDSMTNLKQRELVLA